MINSLRDAGVVVDRWDGKEGSWNLFAPDVYIGASGHRQNIPITRTCKVALHVNPYGPVRIEPNINESKDSIDWVVAKHADVVFGYGHETDRYYWSTWDDIKIPWVPMSTAADATVFNHRHGTHDQFDIGYVGGRWDYKAKNIDKYLIPVLRDKSLTRKVYGWGGWPDGLCSGPIEDSEVPSLLANCKIAPCVSEPHTTTYGIDIPERVFKAALSGAVVVHDPVLGLDRYLPHVTVANSPAEYYAKIKDFVGMSAEARQWIAHRQRKDVLRAHTYHHRMAILMQSLGFGPTADKLLAAVAKYE
jgi:hypothetical protein